MGGGWSSWRPSCRRLSARLQPRAQPLWATAEIAELNCSWRQVEGPTIVLPLADQEADPLMRPRPPTAC